MHYYRAKHLLFILPILALIAGGLVWWYYGTIGPLASVEGPRVVIGCHAIPVELADTPAKQIQGLSDRPSLPAGQGMLFVFPDKQIRSFWMKNMRFPLDIIWIADERVIGIERDLPPAGEKPDNSYSSIRPVNYVLELNGGEVERFGIAVGNMVDIKLQ